MREPAAFMAEAQSDAAWQELLRPLAHEAFAPDGIGAGEVGVELCPPASTPEPTGASPTPMDRWCADDRCSATRQRLKKDGLKFSNGDVFRKIGDVWACKKHIASVRRAQKRKLLSDAQDSAADEARGSEFSNPHCYQLVQRSNLYQM